MTTVAVLCDPPRPGLVLPELVDSTPMTAAEVADLYTALLKDTVAAVVKSGGELLVNYRPDDALPVDGRDAESEVREAVAEIADPEEIRLEVQVGETFSGRVGNTATHLLETEDVSSVAITRPEAAFLSRTEIDGAAMKLRSTDVVLAPSPVGRVYFAAFGSAIDYADAYAAPAFETLTDRALDAGLAVEFLETKPYLETASDLADTIVQVRTRRKAEGLLPRNLAEWVEASDLVVEAGDDGLSIGR
jgi:2-phospho-L-lactate guanylyltransferase (CobY/MobA/RfbA family)